MAYGVVRVERSRAEPLRLSVKREGREESKPHSEPYVSAWPLGSFSPLQSGFPPSSFMWVLGIEPRLMREGHTLAIKPSCLPASLGFCNSWESSCLGADLNRNVVSPILWLAYDLPAESLGRLVLTSGVVPENQEH